MTAVNDELADLLSELAALLRVSKADRFRIRAYERAAAVVRASPIPIRSMDEAEILQLEGIGAAMARLIAEYSQTGQMRMLDELRTKESAGFGALLRLPLIGIRDARALSGTHGFTDIASLQAAAADPDGLRNLDERLAGRVRESLRRLATTVDERLPLPLARRDAAALAEALAGLAGVERVEVAGAVRRCVDTVGSFAFVVVGDPEPVADVVPSSGAVVRVVERTDGVVTVLTPTGRRAELWLTPTDCAGAALLLATGSAGHVEELSRRARAKNMVLDAGGLTDATGAVIGDEASIYAALDLPFIPPELRESAEDIDSAPPVLLTVEDMRGDLHVHSDWSGDGKESIEAMVTAAAARGYAYVALTDHAENLTINGMSRDTVRERRREIARVQQEHPEIRILDSAELNIGLDGSIDYDLEFLLEFDIGVASIHSHMDRLSPVQTERILTAIAHPAVNVIGHPTGRIIGHRPAYGIEIEAIAQAAAETGTALEVNGSPRRLDLCGEMVHAALQAGATIAVSSDAHNTSELGYMNNGVPTARRGWAAAADVLNAQSLDEVLAFVAAKRNGAG